MAAPTYSFLFCREEQGHLEQVTGYGQFHTAPLQTHQAFGDIEAQTAALRIAGGIATNEALGQFLCADVQFLPGDILNRADNPSALPAQVHIYPGTGHRILDHIA